MYTWELYIHERVRDPRHVRGSKTESYSDVYMTFLAKDEVR